MRLTTTWLAIALALHAYAGDAVDFTIMVFDKISRAPVMGAEVSIRDQMTGRMLQRVTGPEGEVTFALNPSHLHWLEVNAIAPSGTSYMRFTYLLTQQEVAAGRKLEVELELVKRERSGAMPVLYFDFNMAYLNDAHIQALEGLVKMFDNFPTLQVEVGVHADCREAKDITAQRAKQISNYLMQKIDNQKIIVREYGATRPANSCDCSRGQNCNDASYAENRRIEFKIISF
ncbi:MAG: OmpA family protein [Chitinophagales bacterium]|nr:OmpA family protein [Chitinophagales bacterium]MDW8417899.1 OmpA family protein [Chitinophagales bacterium]